MEHVALGLGTAFMQLALAHVPVHTKNVQIRALCRSLKFFCLDLNTFRIDILHVGIVMLQHQKIHATKVILDLGESSIRIITSKVGAVIPATKHETSKKATTNTKTQHSN